jgi:hypothetical protein
LWSSRIRALGAVILCRPLGGLRWCQFAPIIPGASNKKAREPQHHRMTANDGGLNGWTQHFIFEGKMEWIGMRQGLSRGYTAAEKTELWDRWQRGETLKAIGRAFGKGSSSIYFQLAPHGGIRPAPRRRSRLALTLVEREEISRGIAAAETARSMARKLGRSPSTVAREISRNGGYDRYRASRADETAWMRARRPKRCKLGG